jgi:hypothetical protein
LPKELRNKSYDRPTQEHAWNMHNVIKNVVFRRVMEIRTQKSKPGLKDMIMESLRKKNLKDVKIRDKMKKLILEMYEK